MTAAELIARLQLLPPDAPVLLAQPGGVALRDLEPVRTVSLEGVHRTPDGDYGQFWSPSLRDRNDVAAVILG